MLVVHEPTLRVPKGHRTYDAGLQALSFAPMNLFTGMSHDQIVSFFIVFAITGYYVTLIAAALVGFWLASRPTQGRVGTAGIWHILAVVLVCFSVVTLVWGAPAQKSFFNDSERTTNMVIGLVVSAVAILCIGVGTLLGRSQMKAMERAS
jgi:hypothetical protein